MIFAQGDVLIERIGHRPRGTTPVARRGGRIILAEGEVTGHAHAIAEDGVEAFERNGILYLKVGKGAAPIDAYEVRRGRDHGWIPVDAGEDRIRAAGFSIVGRQEVLGAPVRHEEHLPFVVEPGSYRVGPQREYTPAEIRRVAD